MAKKEGKRKYLVFLTGEFPYGNGEAFIENELPFLARGFEKVFILVPERAIHQSKRKTPENVFIITVKLKNKWIFRVQTIINFSFWQGIRLDLIRKNRRTGCLNIFRNGWHYFALALLFRKGIQNVIKLNELKPTETIVYSYWLDDKALAAGLIKNEFPEIKAVSRAHRWDVYEEMHPIPFLPFRPWLGDSLDLLIFISKQGKDYFRGQYPEISTRKLVLSYLGTLPLEGSKSEKLRNEFSIASCSSLIPRKRVELMARAILKLSKPINWTHFGDGPEMIKIVMLVKEIENNGGKVNLAGNLPNRDVRQFYAQNPVDLFISTSASEGLPVSMMEAQSAGIPILATNVGGVKEIVIDGVTGWLLFQNPDEAEVAEKIREIYYIQGAEKQNIRHNALKHWQKYFNAEENYAAFVNLLQNP